MQIATTQLEPAPRGTGTNFANSRRPLATAAIFDAEVTRSAPVHAMCFIRRGTRHCKPAATDRSLRPAVTVPRTHYDARSDSCVHETCVSRQDLVACSQSNGARRETVSKAGMRVPGHVPRTTATACAANMRPRMRRVRALQAGSIRHGIADLPSALLLVAVRHVRCKWTMINSNHQSANRLQAAPVFMNNVECELLCIAINIPPSALRALQGAQAEAQKCSRQVVVPRQ